MPIYQVAPPRIEIEEILGVLGYERVIEDMKERPESYRFQGFSKGSFDFADLIRRGIRLQGKQDVGILYSSVWSPTDPGSFRPLTQAGFFWVRSSNGGRYLTSDITVGLGDFSSVPKSLLRPHRGELIVWDSTEADS